MSQLSRLLNQLNEPFDWSSRDIESKASQLGHKLNFTTAARYMAGNHPAKPSAHILKAFADVFGTDVNRLREAAGQAPVNDRFELPPEADQLDSDERRAVVNLIRVMARKKGGEDNASPSLTQAAVSAAPEEGAGSNVHRIDPAPEDPAEFKEFLERQAAKRGKNLGKELRKQQDDDAER